MNYIFQLISLLLLLCSSVQQLGHSRTLEQVELVSDDGNGQMSIQLKLGDQEIVFTPLKRLLKGKYKKQEYLIPRISEVKNQKTHMTTNKICNVIRAPSYKIFKMLDQKKHKLTNESQWERIISTQSVLYDLQDLKKLQFALDIETCEEKNLAVVVFEDGQFIFYQLVENEKLKEVNRKRVFQPNSQHKLGLGSIQVLGDVGFFVSSNIVVKINFNDQSVQLLKNYQQSNFYSTAITKTENKFHLYIASGKSGINHYSLTENSDSLQKISTYKIFINNVENSVVDILQASQLTQSSPEDQVFYVITPREGLLQVKIRRSNSQVQIFHTLISQHNCRMMKKFNKKIYIACPHVLVYEPKNNSFAMSPILYSSPIQILPKQDQIGLLSHNYFQFFDICTHTSQEGGLQGQSFHHTAILKDYYISVDDLSVSLWTVNYPDYFLACQANQMFIGNNSFRLTITSQCQIDEGCCQKSYDFRLQIKGQGKGLHYLQIFGILLLVVISSYGMVFIIYKKRVMVQKYQALIEQNGQKTRNLDISEAQDNKKPSIFTTEENILEDNQKEGELYEKQQKMK